MSLHVATSLDKCRCICRQPCSCHQAHCRRRPLIAANMKPCVPVRKSASCEHVQQPPFAPHIMAIPLRIVPYFPSLSPQLPNLTETHPQLGDLPLGIEVGKIGHLGDPVAVCLAVVAHVRAQLHEKRRRRLCPVVYQRLRTPAQAPHSEDIIAASAASSCCKLCKDAAVL